MRAEYIINAIQAMRAADRLGFTMDPKDFANILHRLYTARIELEHHSGLRVLEITVEKETA
jgi:hypothetical protein